MVTQHCTEALKHGLKVQTWKSHVYVHTSFTIEWENSIMAQNSFPGLVTLLFLQICPLYSPQMLLFLTPSNIWTCAVRIFAKKMARLVENANILKYK